MNISLGNVSIQEFIRRTGYNMSEEDIKILSNHLQSNATIDPMSDKFHIFDIPFSIVVGSKFKAQLIDILMKYENVRPSKETLSINESIKSEKDRERRIKKEKEDLERKERNENPNSIWNVKWYMLVPVVINNKDFYYKCFINTYTKDKANIPNIIEGKAFIRMDEDGLSGRFELFNPERDNDSDDYPDCNFVIGLGLYSLNGSYLGHKNKYTFDQVDFSIAECIENTKKFDNFYREIHFDRIKE